MHVPARIAACLLLALPAVPAFPAAQGFACPRGDAWSLSIGAERALERGAWAVAARDYACAARESTDAAVAEQATRAAYDHLQLELAAESARRWLELAPDSEVARRYLATTLLRGYDEAGAAEQFAKLLETSYVDRARGYLVLLGILSGEDNDTGAARVMDKLAAADAQLPEAHYAAAMLWQRAEHGAKSLAAAERAIALRPDYPQAEFARVRGLTSVGRRAEALELSAKLAAGGDPFMRLAHAWQLLGEDRRDEAVALLEAIRGDGNDASADAATALASIAIDEARLEDAERLIDAASRDPEQAAGARWQRARIAEERGDEIGAALLYRGIETGPRSLGAQLRAHRLLRERGAPEMAEMLIDDYLDSAPGDTVEVIAGVAANLVEEGRGEDAITLIDRARAVLPGDALLLARAFLLERLDRVPEAVDDMREVAESRPNDPTALNALGYTLVDRTKSIEEGTRLIERAVAERPDSYAIQDSMGWALVQAGRFEEGKAWLDKAWEGSEDPEVAAHLGETLWRMGRTAEARKLWDEALSRNPDSRPLKRAIERRTE